MIPATRAIIPGVKWAVKNDPNSRSILTKVKFLQVKFFSKPLCPLNVNQSQISLFALSMRPKSNFSKYFSISLSQIFLQVIVPFNQSEIFQIFFSKSFTLSKVKCSSEAQNLLSQTPKMSRPGSNRKSQQVSLRSQVSILGPLGYGPSTLPLRHSAHAPMGVQP